MDGRRQRANLLFRSSRAAAEAATVAMNKSSTERESGVKSFETEPQAKLSETPTLTSERYERESKEEQNKSGKTQRKSKENTFKKDQRL